MNQRLPQGVIFVIGLAMLLNYVDRGSLATAGPVLQDELSLSSSQIGLLLSAFFWMYAPSQLLAGWLVHRYDVRIVLPAGILHWAVATGLTGLANGFASILLLRLLLGLGESVTFPSAQLIVARHIAEDERGRANGIISAGQGVGPMIGTLFGGLSMAYFGRRAMFLGLGLITVLWVWPWFVLTRGSAMQRAESENRASISYLEIISQREFWGVGIGQFAINYAFYFVITWLPTFLVKAGGFTIEQMAYIGAAIYGIYAMATTVAGAASDLWIRNGGSSTRVRKTFMVAACAGAAVTIALSGLVPPRSAAWLLGLSGVFFGFTTSMLYVIGPTLSGPRAAGRWAGAQNLCGQMAGVIAPWLTGVIVERTGGFSLTFAISAVAAVVAMIAFGIIVRKVEPVAWPEEVAVGTAPILSPSKA
jgi:MFS family permease